MDAAATFHALVGHLEYPMFIVTARAGDDRLGCRTFRRGRDAGMLAVHCVPAGADALAELFGGETGDEVDKFARCAWHDGPGGLPILDECSNWFAGRVVWRADAGDHDVFVLEPVEAEAATGEDEFTFHRAKHIEAGHEA